MSRDDKYEKMHEELILLREEVARLMSPPYMTGTLLDVADKTARVSIDGGGYAEVDISKNLKKEVKKGERLVLNPQTRAIVGRSEFDHYRIGGEISVVDEVDGEKLRLNVKGEQRLVLHNLQDIKPGDEVMLDGSGYMAVKRFDRKKTKHLLEEVKEAPWSNIGGLEHVITRIKEDIEEPFVHREVFEKYGKRPSKGILLYGPPGCGKTLVARSIAYNLSKVNGNGKGKGQFIKINGPEILEKWVGNSEANIRRVYGAARDASNETNSPVVVFIDEAEAVLKRRGSSVSTDIYDSIVPQFLAEMNGMNGNDNVITVLATNREDMLDPAVIRNGRVDKRIKIPRPNKDGAAEIFGIYLNDKPIQGMMISRNGKIRDLSRQLAERIYDGNHVVYNVISPQHGKLGFFTYQNLINGAMIKGMVDRASMFAIRREIDGGKKGISKGDLEKAIDDEFSENTGFAQALVRDDWVDVFGAKGRQYHDLCSQGYLILEGATQSASYQAQLNQGETK